MTRGRYTQNNIRIKCHEINYGVFGGRITLCTNEF